MDLNNSTSTSLGPDHYQHPISVGSKNTDVISDSFKEIASPVQDLTKEKLHSIPSFE